jgi:hypothetical protein
MNSENVYSQAERTHAHNLVMKFDFANPNHANESPEKIMGVIKSALGKIPVIATTFNGLQPRKPLAEKVKALLAVNNEHGKELLAQEITALESWPFAKPNVTDGIYIGDAGPQVNSNTESPLSVRFCEFADAAAADKAKKNLEARAADILKNFQASADALKDKDGNPLLSAEEKKELSQLRLDVTETKNANIWNDVIVSIGIPDDAAPQKLANGRAPLKASAVINKLMTMHAVEGDPVSIGETIARYATMYAGPNWQEVFSQLAGPKEMKGYLESRLQQIKDESLKAQIQEFLKDPIFLTSKEKEEQGHDAQADFSLTYPNLKHPTSYLIDLTLPKGMTPQKIYDSILATQVPKVEHMPTPAPVESAPAAEVPSAPPPVANAPETPAVPGGQTPASVIAAQPPITSAVDRLQAAANQQAGARGAA